MRKMAKERETQREEMTVGFLEMGLGPTLCCLMLHRV
jgi:hypothetical protein